MRGADVKAARPQQGIPLCLPEVTRDPAPEPLPPPPRLSLEDLKDPEAYHERLRAWLKLQH